jgi:beta-lactamase class A
VQKKGIKYVPFELMTSKRIFEEISKNKDITLSVYVRNLDNWPWFGIGENDAFAPIRTLKMPVFIAYLKWSEKNSNVLDKLITLHPTYWSEDHTSFLTKNKLKFNQSYSVRKLLEEMMVYSNDVAMNALIKNIPYSFLTQIDTDLGVLLPWEEDIQDYISLKEYSSFFRILYNASYLSPATSEYALSLLAQTDFPEGIRKGVPSHIDIANKFGEKSYTDDLGEKKYQLHDCGIVYYAQYPYIICISVKGPDITKLPKIIWQTSDIVFEEISKSYP